MQLTASPKEAKRGNYLYKHHLCRLEKNFDAQREPELKAAFAADAARLFGPQAGEGVQQYLDQIYTPLKRTNLVLLSRYSADGHAWHLAQKAVLYENALLRLSELGLDKVIYEDDAVFLNHLRQIHDDERKALRTAVEVR